MDFFLAVIMPFFIYIPIIFIVWWMLKLKRNTEKQVEQNNEIIELLKHLNNK
ncbi:hypothetical protein [Desulfuribacillus alkaliarsenatis]|uniref:hypothetical protein n=1 Tax=Desulfuribacillus alkaliarsenatis TaxID=766136 RepID=UPI0015B5A98A|nr:hypothetical protein [Desulfuribacillus alkaliarsenatis]